MKKIIVSVACLIIIIVGIITSTIFKKTVEDYEDSVNKNEISGVDQDESKDEIAKDDVEETSEIVEENETNSSSEEKKSSQSESQAPISSDKSSSKTQTSAPKTSNSSSSNSPSTNDTTNSQTQNDSTTIENNTSEHINIISTAFYDSITGGKKEFRTEEEATARGNQIVQNEMNEVFDYNEAHPDNKIQPDINYFRVYPSAIDEDGNYWYYLHFFCVSGEDQDEYLKSKY